MILAQQILFATDAARRLVALISPAETPLKLIPRHQQQLGFFDRGDVVGGIRIVDISGEVVEGSATRVLESIARDARPPRQFHRHRPGARHDAGRCSTTSPSPACRAAR